MTSCSCVVVRIKVNSGIGLGRLGSELALVLRVLMASPCMLDRFLSTSLSGMVGMMMMGLLDRCDVGSRRVSAYPQEMSKQSEDSRFRLYRSHGQVRRVMLAILLLVTC